MTLRIYYEEGKEYVKGDIYIVTTTKTRTKIGNLLVSVADWPEVLVLLSKKMEAQCD